MKPSNRAIAVAAYGATFAIRRSQFMIISFAIRYLRLGGAISQIATKASRISKQHNKENRFKTYKT